MIRRPPRSPLFPSPTLFRSARYPGGVLIDLPHNAGAERVAATKQALDDGAPAVFEATFIADGTFVAIDVLEKRGDGYRLTEVKSSTSQKDEHIPDVAVQARVAAACGVNVTAAEVMHLNKEFRYPDTGDLFARTDVTGPVAAFLPQVPDEIDRKSTRLNSSHLVISYAVFCLKKKKTKFIKMMPTTYSISIDTNLFFHRVSRNRA